MVAIIIVVLVGTINDWQMERSFNQLNKKHNDRTVKVVRSGKSSEISVFNLMVGDVMHLSTGDLVPVDGIFIEGHGVKCDESSATGESDLLRKVSGDEVFAAIDDIRNNKAEHPDIEKLDPFIISGSKVQEGTGTFLVTAVGVNLELWTHDHVPANRAGRHASAKETEYFGRLDRESRRWRSFALVHRALHQVGCSAATQHGKHQRKRARNSSKYSLFRSRLLWLLFRKGCHWLSLWHLHSRLPA